MNRTELRQLAEERVRESQTLLDFGLWSGAYYLIGYAIECGLKACILAHIEKTGAIFDDRKFSEKCWTHRAEDLARLANLEDELKLEISKNPLLEASWSQVKDWNESSRYRLWTELDARTLFEAVTDPNCGVLPWIKGQW